MHTWRSEMGGFTLPTVVIASVIMLAVLATTLQLVASTSSVLRDQYYIQLAREAVESGVAHASECLKNNSYVPGWTAARPLRPNTDCAGVTNSSASSYVLDSGDIRSYYSVGFPTGANGTQRVIVDGQVELLRSGSSTIWKSFAQTGAASVGAAISFNTVVFGYSSSFGAFFSVMYPGGKVMSTGYNGNGQHGKGNYTSSAIPAQYQLPSGQTASEIYTSFLSSGSRIFVATSQGNLYGSGIGSSGQLGNGLMSNRTLPVRFNLPTGVAPRGMSLLLATTFVIGSDHNVYAAGACSNGILGNTYTISGCTSQSTPVRVALPAVNTANSNTLPALDSGGAQSGNIVSDARTAFVRMQGGSVYGWGANNYGQLGDGTTTDRSTPVKVGTFGNSGQPRATQLAFDGDTLYILDNAGDVWAVGYNGWGGLAGAGSQIRNWGSNGSDGLCIDGVSASSGAGTRVRTVACSSATAQLVEFLPVSGAYGNRGLLRVVASGRCINNSGNGTANGNAVVLADCNEGQMSQLWRYDSFALRHPSTGKCMDKASNNNLQMWDCNGSAPQFWLLQNSSRPTKVPLPAGRRITKITTDQYSVLFLMDNGSVWGAGSNRYGQLGNGDTTPVDINPALRSFILPSAARDIYTTLFGDNANTFAVLTNGQVYGAGRNHYGQLGIGSSSTTDRLTPVRMQLPSGVQVQSVQTGLGTTVVLTTDGKIYTVGNNSHGQLGDGTTQNSSTPRLNRYTNEVPVMVY